MYILIHRREHVAGSVPLVSAQWSRLAQCAWVPRCPGSVSGFRLGLGAGNLYPMFEILLGNALWWAT